MNISECFGKTVEQLDTPCLLIDMDMLEKNLLRMQSHANEAGKSLRPHAKTHKCSKLAKLQISGGAVGVCVAKVSEACVLTDNGVRNILITSPVVTEHKIARLMECVRKSPEIAVVVDNPQNVRHLGREAVKCGVTLNVFIDIDPGLGRTGVPFAEALDFAKFTADCPGLAIKGIQCYAGHLQHVKTFSERREKSLDVMRRAAEVANDFKKHGLPCETLTGTGTGTFDIDSLVPEVTEMQVGSYVLMDAEYQAIGSAAHDRFESFAPALSILTSVISTNRASDGWVTVDAGLKAIYHHGATPIILGRHTELLTYDWFGDEQGKIIGSPTILPQLGEKTQLMVSHCDPTVNLFDNFYIMRNGKVIDVWPIDLRGCCR